MTTEQYDLAIIGGGSAGLTAARVGVALGAKVALIDRSPAALGGDCLHTGCVPSKALIHAARAHWAAGQTTRWGLPERSSSTAVDLASVMAGVREIQAQAGEVDTPAALGALGIALYFGHARFTSPASLIVEGEPIPARRYIIATGSQPALPTIPGFDTIPYLTNQTIFNLGVLPASLLVIGGGPIGCELGQAFARLGTRVTIVGRADRLLPKEDPEASHALQEAFTREGIEVITAATIERLRQDGESIVATIQHGTGNEERRAAAVLIATGRTVTTASLDLHLADVRTNERGIVVDDYARTTNPNIYAAGDVLGQRFFTQIAGYQASIAVTNALLSARRRLDYRAIPWTTFTSPEVARIGLTEAEAIQRGIRAESSRFAYQQIDRALTARAAEGNFIKIVHDSRGKILGAQIVGPSAGETINEIAIAMKQHLSLSQFSEASHVYPTLGMGLQQAALAWRAQSRLARNGRRILRPLFAWQRRRAKHQAQEAPE